MNAVGLRQETREWLDFLGKRKTQDPSRWSEVGFNTGVLLLAKALGHEGTGEAMRLLRLKALQHKPQRTRRSIEAREAE